MKLIPDEGVPLRVAELLRQKGVEATHILELGMGGASDHAGRSDTADIPRPRIPSHPRIPMDRAPEFEHERVGRVDAGPGIVRLARRAQVPRRFKVCDPLAESLPMKAA